MCGITGIFAYGFGAGQIHDDELLALRETMRKRGPDGAGLWVSDDGRIGLAHRRLSIILPVCVLLRRNVRGCCHPPS